MRKKTITVNGVDVSFKVTKDNIKIIDSYKIKDEELMLDIILNIVTFHDKYSENRDRTIFEWIEEWKTHNILYKIPLKYFKDHCRDCDFTNGESDFRLFVYSILGKF